MLIPIGHDVDGLRRWPVVTFAIIGICIAVLVGEQSAPPRKPEAVAQRFQEAAEYYLEHPELEAHPLLQRWLDAALEAQPPDVRDEIHARLAADAETTPLQDVRQRRLDELTTAWLAELRDGAAGRFGLVPSEIEPTRFLTHLFVHAGILHLFFNMLFLYLTGPLIEDVWGRGLFALFYLGTGVAAAWLYAQQYPDLAVPLIGASGAVAGVLGATLVRHPRTRIRFLWVWGFVVRRFTTPAWVVLPIWVAGEALWAVLMDAFAPGSGGGGVAYWVHVYGFAIGVGTAGFVAASGWERLVAPRTPGDAAHPVLRAVDRALAGDRREEAWTLLRRHVAAVPADHDAALAYWDLATSLGRACDAAPVLLRVIRAELAAGELERMLAHWTELQRVCPTVAVETDLAARLASALGDAGARAEAAALVRDALARVEVGTPPAALVALVHAARFADDALAAAVTARALAHPGLPLAVRRELATRERPLC